MSKGGVSGSLIPTFIQVSVGLYKNAPPDVPGLFEMLQWIAWRNSTACLVRRS